MKFFIPEQKTLNELFIDKTTYLIPSYQRLYSWEAKGKSDRDSQVNVMWEDLIEHFELDKNKHYFMGSMVFIEVGDDIYEVVDGQQRLTTLTLLFVAIKCVLQELKDTEIEAQNRTEIKAFIRSRAIQKLDDFLFNETWEGFIRKEKKVKIEHLAGFDYDQVLKIAMECGHIQQINLSNTMHEQAKTVRRYFDNRNYLKVKIKTYFTDNRIFTKNKLAFLNEFIVFLQKKVTVIRILCPSLEVAYQVFEILNNRGLPLSNKDLFRNFIIKELHQSNVETPEKKWLNLDSYQFSAEFLGRYVESKTGNKQRSSAFNDVKEVYEKLFETRVGKKKIEVFYNDVEINLQHYTDIELLSFDNLEIKHRIDFLRNSGNSRYITNLLLALLRSVREENRIIIFLKALELFILYQLLGPSKRFPSSTIFDSVNWLNQTNFNEALSIISLTITEKKDLKDRLVKHDIRNDNLAKLVIARFFWAKEMDAPEDVIKVELFYKIATLEHIIPQKPKAETNWKKDFSAVFRKHYTYKLGNMTLLTHPMNSRAKNYAFSKKQAVYKKTKLLMTNQLSQLNSIDETYIKNRHEKITGYLVKHLGL